MFIFVWFFSPAFFTELFNNFPFSLKITKKFIELNQNEKSIMANNRLVVINLIENFPTEKV